MYPPPFDYRTPESLDGVLELLAEYGDEAKLVAGGMSLIPLLKLRFAEPAVLVDLNALPELDFLEEGPDGLRVGALVRHDALARSPAVRRDYPTMAAAAPLIADPLVRNRGTLAGSLAHADPAGDWGSVMIALGAQVVARSSQGERVIPVRDLFTGTFTTVLDPTELLTEVRVPAQPSNSGGTYHKLERKVGDFGTVGVATSLRLTDGRVGGAGIGLTSVGAHNLAATEAERFLAGTQPTAEALAEAADLAARAAEPQTDIRGSSEYKRQVVRVFVRRGLESSRDAALAA